MAMVFFAYPAKVPMVHTIIRGLLAGCIGLLLGLGAAQAQIKIVALGDSDFEGRDLAQSETFPGQLEAALKAKGHNVVIKNSGRWGDTTSQLLARLDAGVPPGTQIALVIGGSNDERLGKSFSEIRDNLFTIVKRLRARNIQVLLFLSGPKVRAEANSWNWNKDGLTILGNMREGVPNDKGYYFPDGVHLTRAAYAIAVQRVLPTVEQVVAKVKAGS
jgi:acyl-CoA thioesterase-1